MLYHWRVGGGGGNTVDQPVLHHQPADPIAHCSKIVYYAVLHAVADASVLLALMNGVAEMAHQVVGLAYWLLHQLQIASTSSPVGCFASSLQHALATPYDLLCIGHLYTQTYRLDRP